jgi:hypothetical protein
VDGGGMVNGSGMVADRSTLVDATTVLDEMWCGGVEEMRVGGVVGAKEGDGIDNGGWWMVDDALDNGCEGEGTGINTTDPDDEALDKDATTGEMEGDGLMGRGMDVGKMVEVEREETGREEMGRMEESIHTLTPAPKLPLSPLSLTPDVSSPMTPTAESTPTVACPDKLPPVPPCTVAEPKRVIPGVVWLTRNTSVERGAVQSI